MEHHDLDVYPVPKDSKPLFINEPWLVDRSLLNGKKLSKEPETDSDNRRVYIPMDLNKNAILRRLNEVILRYGEANERNESWFEIDVDAIISQLEIYDQIWYVRHMPEHGDHSAEAISLVREMVAMLEEIPDGGAECFPFELIDSLREEFLS